MFVGCNTDIFLPVTDKVNYGLETIESYPISLLGDEHCDRESTATEH